MPIPTALALVAFTGPNAPLAGVVAQIQSADGAVLLFGVTNRDGYLRFVDVPLPFSGTLQLTGTAAYYEQALMDVHGSNVTLRVGPSPANPQDVLLPACAPFKRPFTPAPRVWRGNMCGSRVQGIPPVAGGAADPSLVLTWFYDRYTSGSRALIRTAWQARGYSHVVLSWPDSRDFGQSPQQFLATCQELITAGFFPCVFLYSKDYDPQDAPGILANIAEVLPLLLGTVPLFCVGWELSIALSPQTVQTLIDALAPQVLPTGARLYVHFQGGYFAFQPDGQPTSAFWQANVGKLHGILHQRDLNDLPGDKANYQARLVDCLQRFAGQFGFPVDSGFGHPFDLIALEITAQPVFNGEMTEAEADSWGTTALQTPGESGLLGPVVVMGSGNGQET